MTLVETAVERLRYFEPDDGYYLAFSGGKDSVVIHDLAMKAGVRFDAHYNVSPIDPPEIHQFIKRYYQSVVWDIHAKNFWKRFMYEGPPLRTQRWCCELIKEAGGKGRLVLTGIRWAESSRRRGRMLFEPCFHEARTFYLHPIIDWSTEDVWAYIRDNGLAYCKLYDEGFTRLGCVLCPYAGNRDTARALIRFPKLVRVWQHAFERYFTVRQQRGTPLTQATWQEYWDWWISRKRKQEE